MYHGERFNAWTHLVGAVLSVLGALWLLLLRFQQGLAYDEIALVTSLPLGTVKTGLHRARAKLKEALRVYDEVLVAV